MTGTTPSGQTPRENNEEIHVASNAGKKSGRVTAKGTQPPVKKPRVPGQGGSKQSGRGDAPAESAVPATPNRQMRRAGLGGPEQPDNPQADRMKWILIGGGAVSAVLVITCVVAFRVSGTWVGLLGLIAGFAAGIAVSTGKTWAATKGREIAIGIAVFGALATALGVSGLLDFHWPLVALFGCGLGAAMAELSSQQMTPPQSPPQSALALLRRNGAQQIPAPSTGSCVWATPDGRIRVIVGASIPEGTEADKVLTDKNVRKSRQKGAMLLRRMAGLGAQPGITCVVDSAITTVRDGDDIVCSAAGLTKALSR